MTTEASRRSEVCGLIQLAEPASRLERLKFLDQFRNWLIGILLIQRRPRPRAGAM